MYSERTNPAAISYYEKETSEDAPSPLRAGYILKFKVLAYLLNIYLSYTSQDIYAKPRSRQCVEKQRFIQRPFYDITVNRRK